MKKVLLLLLFACQCSFSYSQIELPFSFTSEDENRMIKEEDSGKYFVASGDTSRVVFLNEEASSYRLFDKDHKLLADGNFSVDGEKYQREGKWREYYTNGTIKGEGYYHKNTPLGIWRKFYPSGKLMVLCNYATIENGTNYYCMAGAYQEYYENGQLKTNGFYKATIDDLSLDTTYVVDPVTETKIKKISKGKPRPEKYGVWERYNDKGELDKKEDF